MATQAETEKGSTVAPVSGLVPMIHVADTERSIEFYRLLGFEVGNSVPKVGTRHWAWLYSPQAPDWRRGANLMVASSERAIDAKAQAVLFYLYATDLVALRNSLIAKGVRAGEIKYPEYLPKGEFRMEDPDGYCVMVAQSGTDTP